MESILIVEDEGLIASSIKNILRHLGYSETYIAASSTEAIQTIEDKNPDLVLADIVLEGDVNGIEMAKQIKEKYKIPLIYLTAHSDEKTIEKAKMSEPYGFITKPFKIEELRIALEIAFHKFKMEKKVLESEEKYHLLTEAVMDIIFSLDQKGKFTFISSAFDRITGLNGEKYIGKHFTSVLASERIEEALERFKQRLSGEELPLFETEIIRKGGKTIPVEINTTSFDDKIVERKGFIGTIRDISKRKLSEEELKNTSNLLHQTQEELIQTKTLANLGVLAAGIAHEIRNPLANISALSQYSMRKFKLDEQMRNNLEAIMRSSERANGIIKDLLDFAKPRELKIDKISIIDIISRVCKLTEAKRLNQQVILQFGYEKNLPKIEIDEKQIEQTLMNIVMNSIEAMPKGGCLTINVKQVDGFILIAIQDTGKGIPKKNIDKIFNPFFTNKKEGVGLGLSVAHRIIQSHKGKVDVKSTYNKGTTFTIALPVHHDDRSL